MQQILIPISTFYTTVCINPASFYVQGEMPSKRQRSLRLQGGMENDTKAHIMESHSTQECLNSWLTRTGAHSQQSSHRDEEAGWKATNTTHDSIGWWRLRPKLRTTQEHHWSPTDYCSWIARAVVFSATRSIMLTPRAKYKVRLRETAFGREGNHNRGLGGKIKGGEETRVYERRKKRCVKKSRRM